jgi:ClpP class serine protease
MEFWAIGESELCSFISACERAEAQAPKGAVAPSKTGDIWSESGNTAVIRIEGVLTPTGLPLIYKLFGIRGTAYSDIVEAAELLASDSKVTKVVLDMDTPGGTVAGVEGAYKALRDLAATKDVVAVNRGMIASAGYWLASAAGKIVALDETSQTGSLGVVATVQRKSDSSREVVSKNAPLKRPDSETEEGMAEFQRQLDAIERVFFSHVAEGRGVSVEHVVENYGQGGLYLTKDPGGKDALDMGLVDALVCGREEIFEAKGKGMDKELQELQAKLADKEARIQAVLPFLGAKEYPGALLALAVEVLRGSKSCDVLDGAVAVYDAMKAADAQALAEVDSAEVGDVQLTAGAPASMAGEVESPTDFAAAVARMKGNK